jgi:uncharacterized membrane protein
MKQIEPFEVWTEKGVKIAKYLDSVIIRDNMNNFACFYWQLFDEKLDEEGNPQPNESIRQGNVDMNPEQYEEWDNSNEQGYEFVASQINVTIL